MSYIALDFIKNYCCDIDFETQKKTFHEMGIAPLNDDENFKKFLRSSNFMNPLYKGKYRNTNDYIRKNLYSIINLIGCTKEDVESGKVNLFSEWSDIIYMPYLYDEWRRNKQVYKIDKDMANALYTTKGIEFYRKDLLHLPCNTFYIDLSDCIQFDPIVGTFVNISVYENEMSIYYSMIRKDLVAFSWECYAEFSPDGKIEWQNSNNDSLNISYEYDFCGSNKKISVLPRKEVAGLAAQIICYIVSKEPDIKESPITKSTYKPTKNNIIKDKFSEIQMHDVGIRFGNSIRKKHSKSMYDKTVLKTISGTKYDSQRKPPVPHYRSAHWQRYHVGKGRKETINLWIAPVFVGYKEAKDVVIHSL